MQEVEEAFYQYVDEVLTATYSKPLAFTHNCCERMQGNVMHADNDDGVQDTHSKCNINQHDVKTNSNHHMSNASLVGRSVDDLTYDSKMVGNANQDITTHNSSLTTGRAESSVGVLVIHPDCDTECEDIDNVIPNNKSWHSYIMSLIVDLTDEFLKEGQLTKIITPQASMNLTVLFSRRRTCNFFRMQDTNHCVTTTTGS